MVRILIADDSAVNIELLKTCLECEGYEVVTATNGQQALEAAAENRPDAILLDVLMPVMGGVETCKKLKQDESLSSIPVIMVTSLNREEDVIRGLDAGADDYVTKPYNERVVVARTRAAVKRHQAAAENARLMDELSRQATTDPLTSLLNRRTFYEHFARELSLAERHELPLSVVLLDIDFFKKINDDYGHPVGDATLVAMATMLRSQFRTTDYICRYGGEEFAALLPQTDEASAVDWAERARSEIGKLVVPTGDVQLRMTASFGVASRQSGLHCAEEILHCADEALLVAKRTGRNRVVAASGASDPSPLPDVESQTAEAALQGILAGAVMTTPVACISQDAWLDEATQLLLELRVNSVPVTDDDGMLVGILSEKDIMVALAAGDLCQPRVRDQMSTNVMSFQETDSAQSIFRFLCRNAIRRVVIVDGGRPTGVLSRGGLLRGIMGRSLACRR